jgi:hypothetical protein
MSFPKKNHRNGAMNTKKILEKSGSPLRSLRLCGEMIVLLTMIEMLLPVPHRR